VRRNLSNSASAQVDAAALYMRYPLRRPSVVCPLSTIVRSTDATSPDMSESGEHRLRRSRPCQRRREAMTGNQSGATAGLIMPANDRRGTHRYWTLAVLAVSLGGEPSRSRETARSLDGRSRRIPRVWRRGRGDDARKKRGGHDYNHPRQHQRELLPVLAQPEAGGPKLTAGPRGP
jgi:hypothetical protein